MATTRKRKRAPLYEPKYHWDGKWRELDFRGATIILFGRSALAKALNRSVVAIRRMEATGVLCKPRLQDPRYPHQWLYTESQILDLIQLSDREGVLNPNYKRPFSERFKTEAKVILNRLPGEEVRHADSAKASNVDTNGQPPSRPGA